MKRLTYILISLLITLTTGNSIFARHLSDNHILLSEEAFSQEDAELDAANFAPASASLDVYYEGQLREFDFEEIDNEEIHLTDLGYEYIDDSFSKDDIFENAGNTIDSAQQFVHNIADKVKSAKNYISRLDNLASVELPVGILPENGDENYLLVIDNIQLTPQGGLMDIYMSFEIPNKGQKLAFGAKEIPFSHDGGITGIVQIQLLNDFPIKLGKDMGMILKSQGQTYVEFDCDGYKSMGISADLIFSKNSFVPENPDGTIKNEYLQTSFSLKVADWNNLLVEVDIPAFQIKGIKGLGFEIKQAVLDFSDIANSPNMIFPEEYESTLTLPGNMNLWRGVYISEAAIRLPKEFKKQSTESTNNGRLEFQVYNLLVDNMGFSGTFIAENLIKEKEGDMGGWAFSISKFGVSFVASELKEAGFEGSMNIPLFKENSAIDYTAIIKTGGEYIISASPQKSMDVSLWVAKAEIYPTSSITVEVLDGIFNATAELDGKMNIEAPISEGSSKKASLANIAFERMIVSTKKPFFQLGNVSFGSANSCSFGTFPISLENIALFSESSKVGLQFNVSIKLVGQNDGGFGADAGLKVYGEIPQESSATSWKFGGVELTEAGIDISGPAFKLAGRIKFFKEDPEYGNGFNGTVNAEFKPGIKLDATVLFGKVGDLRYWYADAMIDLNKGIPISPGFGIYGFGGGAYFHMKRKGFNDTGGSDLGKNASGIIYMPDQNTHMGFKAMVYLGMLPGRKVFNGDASLEITFNKGGGINRIVFEGNGYFVTPPIPDQITQLKEKCEKLAGNANYSSDQLETGAEKGSIAANILIDFDIANSTLHANLKVYVNVAGIIKGVNSGNLAGEAVLHFSPGSWYIHIGSPDKPVGIQIMSIFKTKSYFMVGDEIPGSPPPPPEVSEILGGIDLDYMKELNALGNGSGIAFGSRLELNTGNLQFLIFYASFKAGLGFDIMLKNYGNATCEGRSGPIGINGWYANGQAFAYFEGAIGIRVKVFMKKINAEILKIGAAVILQAKLPNPTWMRGIVGGRFSILGGLVKGNCKFEVTIGEECKIAGGSILEGIEVISDVTPGTGSKDVNVFTIPQAVFNMPIEKVFELVDLDEKKKSFKIKLEYFNLYDGSSKINCESKWNGDKDVIALKSFDILPGEKSIKAKVQVSFVEMINGSWVAVTENGQKLTQQKEITFITGKAPDYIPHNNVLYCYPIINQYNFYPQEYNQGYIKLERGQPYLFTVSNEWVQKSWFIDAYGNKKMFSFAYDAANKQVNFNIPSGLVNNTIYAFEIVNVPANAAEAIDVNVSETEINTSNDNESIDVSFSGKKAEGSISELQIKQVFTAPVRVSLYNTFSQKFNALGKTAGSSYPIDIGVHILSILVHGGEFFDKFELIGSKNYERLVQFEADINNTWIQDQVYPLIYKNYPVENLEITWRNIDSLSLIPYKAVKFKQVTNYKILEESEISNNSPSMGGGFSNVEYELAYYIDKDHAELKQKAANLLLNVSSNWLHNLLYSQFPNIKQDVYKIKIKYVLPGINKISSTNHFTITKF